MNSVNLYIAQYKYHKYIDQNIYHNYQYILGIYHWRLQNNQFSICNNQFYLCIHHHIHHKLLRLSNFYNYHDRKGIHCLFVLHNSLQNISTHFMYFYILHHKFHMLINQSIFRNLKSMVNIFDYYLHNTQDYRYTNY